MEYKVNYKQYEFIVTQNEDGSFNIPEDIRDLEPFGTALKPAAEYIVVARKPLSEKSVALNVLKWGTGGINIDGCRISTTDTYNYKNGPGGNSFSVGEKPDGKRTEPVEMNSEGRFPANIILECLCDEVIKGDKGEVKSNTREAGNSFNNYDDKVGKVVTRIENYGDKGDIHTNPLCPCYMMDEQSGVSSGQVGMKRVSGQKQLFNEVGTELNKQEFKTGKSDKGGASRFFYQAKVSKAERNMGLDGFDDKEKIGNLSDVVSDSKLKVKNNHPTVKPVNLMAYLCRLVTPPNGIVLDPYMGSGSTGIAAQLEGFRFVGMELDEDYFKIAEARIENFESYRKFIK